MLKQLIYPDLPLHGFPFVGDDVFARFFQEPHGCVRLYVLGTRCAVFMEGDCTPNEAVAAVTQYRQQGLILPVTEVFVIMTYYTGTVDWSFIRTIPNLLIWQPPPKKLAFLVANDYMAKIAKVAGAFINVTQSSVFVDINSAYAWLGWLEE